MFKKRLSITLMLLLTLAISILTLSACVIGESKHPHDLGEWIEEVPATCTSTGTLGHYHCTECNKDFNAKKKEIKDLTIPAAHTLGKWVEEVAATCTSDGTVGYYHCSACNKNFDKNKTELQSLTIPKAHKYADGKCSLCGAERISQGLSYELIENNTAYAVVGMGTCTDSELIIPSEYNGLPVTSIGYSAFYDCDNLTSITIPDSVTSIGEGAFRGCDNLKAVYITDISKWCGISFEDAYANPFYFANNLYLNGELVTTLVIPDDVTEIEDYVFYDCDSLTIVTIPGSVTSIGSYAFWYCSGLTSVTIGNGVTSIGERAFSGCSSLTSVTIPDSVTSIGNGAFSGCYSLTSITIPDSVTYIASFAFSGCSSLTSVTIPDSVTSIGENAFSACSKLVEVIDKSSLNITKGFGENGYVAYYALEVHNGESKIVNKDNYLFYTYNNVNYLIGYVGKDTNLTLPESYNGQNYEIYKYAFYRCDSLTSVTIPDSVTSIGNGAFLGCSNLTSVTIPDSVTYIPYEAFYSCDSLTDVYYTGTEEQWKAISIEDYNSNLTSATIHYDYQPQG